MSVSIRVEIHDDRIRAALHSPAGPPAEFVRRRCQIAVNFAKVACPVDQGRLRQSITSRVSVEAGRVVGSVYSPVHYARYVHEGTGIYGPRRQWIYPKRGNFFVFETKGVKGPLPRGVRRKPKGRRDLVFARRVRGIPSHPFLVYGLEMAMPGVPINRH